MSYVSTRLESQVKGRLWVTIKMRRSCLKEYRGQHRNFIVLGMRRDEEDPRFLRLRLKAHKKKDASFVGAEVIDRVKYNPDTLTGEYVPAAGKETGNAEH